MRASLVQANSPCQYISSQISQTSASNGFQVSSDVPNCASAFIRRRRLVLATLVKPFLHHIAINNRSPTDTIDLYRSVRSWIQPTWVLQISNKNVLKRR